MQDLHRTKGELSLKIRYCVAHSNVQVSIIIVVVVSIIIIICFFTLKV